MFDDDIPETHEDWEEPIHLVAERLLALHEPTLERMPGTKNGQPFYIKYCGRCQQVWPCDVHKVAQGYLNARQFRAAALKHLQSEMRTNNYLRQQIQYIHEGH